MVQSRIYLETYKESTASSTASAQNAAAQYAAQQAAQQADQSQTQTQTESFPHSQLDVLNRTRAERGLDPIEVVSPSSAPDEVRQAIPQGASVDRITKIGDMYTIHYSVPEPPSVKKEPSLDDYSYKGFMNVEGAGGIGADPVITSNTEAMGKSTLITPVSVQLLKFSDTIPKGEKVLESSFADVSGAGGIGADPVITGKTPVYAGDIAKGAVNFAAGLAAWGESLAFAPTVPGFSSTAEKYPGYTFGTVAPDIAIGAKFISDLPGIAQWAKIKLLGDPKTRAYEKLIKEADPLAKIKLDEAAQARNISSVEKTYRVAAYSDPLATASEDRLLWMRDYAGKPRPVFPNEKPPSPSEYFRPSVDFAYDAKLPKASTTPSAFESPKGIPSGGGGALAQELRVDEKALQSFSKSTAQADLAKSAARSAAPAPVKGAVIAISDVAPKIAQKSTQVNPIVPTVNWDETKTETRPEAKGGGLVVPVPISQEKTIPDTIPDQDQDSTPVIVTTTTSRGGGGGFEIPTPAITDIPTPTPSHHHPPFRFGRDFRPPQRSEQVGTGFGRHHRRTAVHANPWNFNPLGDVAWKKVRNSKR